jgi:glycosyltransferase involved in cell wall biosynthesis
MLAAPNAWVAVGAGRYCGGFSFVEEVIMTAPRVSVLMPVYNCQEFIQAAIDSILNQTFSDFEFIIINDGSTDATNDLVVKAAGLDDRIKVVSRANRGIIASLNEGLDMARGDLIARMDGDDLALPDRFARQVAFLDASPQIGLVGGQAMLVDPDARALMSIAQPLLHNEILAKFFTGATSLWHPTVMFRRAIAVGIGGYGTGYEHAEDVDFFLRFSEHGQLANLGDMLLHYRLHPKSIGSTKANAQALAHYRAASDAALRLGFPAPSEPDLSGRDAPIAELYMRWGWWALQGGHVSTARRYGVKAVASRPASRESWRLVACALRGH